MHPAIRVLIVIIITAFMVAGGIYPLFAGILLSLALNSTAGFGTHTHLARMIVRIRWLLASIMILYAWFSPGSAMIPALEFFSPSRAGLSEGLLRCAVLIVILTLVHWLVNTTRREELIQGVYWLIQPLTLVALKPEVVAVRLALVLETVPIMQHKLTMRASGGDVNTPSLQRIVRHGTAVLDAALYEADRAELMEIELTFGRAPSIRDWAILSMIVGVLSLAVLLHA
jgi:hypothetical protein